jgi:hypothetical protein
VIDLDDFRKDHEEALAQAHEYARRVEKGLPADRFVTGTKNAVLVGRGIRAQAIIIAMLTDALEQFLRPSTESTGVFDRNGNERN